MSQILFGWTLRSAARVLTLVGALPLGLAAPLHAADRPDSRTVAAAIDRLILDESRASQSAVASRTRDEDFLRRVTFDLAGTLPSPKDVTLFGLDPDAEKREKLIDRLLDSDDCSRNWARYWRDVIFTRATDMRAGLAQQTFEDWMHGQLKQNEKWDRIATALLTATGDVRENGATALIFVHGGDAAELAGEVSRIFLGIQIQCANCHDHPTDGWKREQFHELAAFFPRTTLRPTQAQPRSFEVASLDSLPGGGLPGGGGDPLAQFRENPERAIRFLDKNSDGKLSKTEVEDAPLGRIFERLLQIGDSNRDGLLSADELRKFPPPMMRPDRGSREYFMPDLANPGSRGKQIDPVFFVSLEKPGKDRTDETRRESLAKYVTSPKNAWFSKAYVNRIWGEMLGEAFYMPIDDLGPQRSPREPKVLDALAEGFAANEYDVRWLFRTIALTQAYQRSIRAKSVDGSAAAFIAAAPTRLRSDQLYTAILRALGLPELNGFAGRPMGDGNPFNRGGGPRQQFAQLFAFDPSTPQDDIVGSVPQALFLMNAPQLNNQVRADGNTVLAQILKKLPKDDDAINELYLQVLAREPSDRELKIGADYIAEVKNRGEAFEDLMWSLLNSSEFLSKR